LAALPLIALPVIIHLIHQRRHRTVPWAAMMFLLQAKQMNQGMARLRHLLILLMRMAAVGALIFALSRPLAGGWWGGIGMTEADATLILLDRSASMETQDLQTGESRRSTALGKLAALLDGERAGGRLVLIDSADDTVRTLESPRALADLPFTSATATSADLPGMLERALAHLTANDAGRADVWICSDLAENDWDPGSGRWAAIREQFARLKGTRLFLLAYPQPPANNLSVRVANVSRHTTGKTAELSLDVEVRHGAGEGASGGTARHLPLEFEVNNVRSVVEVELDEQGASLQGHRLPIDAKLEAGWGSVAIPGDANPQDNRFHFVFAEPPVRRAVIVAEEAQAGEAFRLALAIPPEPGREHAAQVLSPARVGEIDWETTGMLIWQAPFPGELVADQIERFVSAGRVAMFWPPEGPDDGSLFGSHWTGWETAGEPPAQLAWWRGEADLLGHVGNGDALPVDELKTYRWRALEGPGTVLARLANDQPLLVRAATDQGAVYFCATLPTARCSSLERDGVVFYAMLQRALTEGCRPLATASQREAGRGALGDRDDWSLVAPGGDAAALSQRGLQSAVFRSESGGNWAALNRPKAEDTAGPMPAATVDALFAGLAYQRIDDTVGNASPLAREIWRMFLLAMLVALIVEAVLCLPDRRVASKRTSEFAPATGAAG
ncbi:MAG: BatA domain-containing protein, partial [Verrucomicrobiae bacterium]|nr:BatA domain-containing protein [Verrucomicrobiae bacterium]